MRFEESMPWAKAKGSVLRATRLPRRRRMKASGVRHTRSRGRHYSPEHLDRLRFIKRAQALGFSLPEIEALLSLSTSDCAEAERVASRKLSLVREKLADLSRIESVLERAIAHCQTREAYEGCPIIESLIRPKT